MPDTNEGIIIMKKFFQLFVLVVVMVSLASCGESKLQKTVKEVNKECPISMGVVGEISSLEYKDGNVVFNYLINEDITNIDALKGNEEMMKRSVVTTFSNSTGDTKNMIDELVKEGAGLILNFKGKDSGKTVTLNLTKDEIVSIGEKDEKDADPLAVLQEQIKVTNAQCPVALDKGMTMEGVSFEGNNVVYRIVVDESVYSMDDIISNKEASKIAVKASLENDRATAAFVKFCVNAERGLAYKYVGNKSGKSCLIEFSVSELR